MSDQPLRVLFLCTANSARSQMAEAILRHLSHGQIHVASAGSAPAVEIHPMACLALGKLGIPLDHQHPKSWDRFMRDEFDFIITVCDRSAEQCPVFPGDPERIHWSCEDPAALDGSAEERQRAFDRTATQLVNRMRIWMSLPSIGGTVRR